MKQVAIVIRLRTRYASFMGRKSPPDNLIMAVSFRQSSPFVLQRFLYGVALTIEENGEMVVGNTIRCDHDDD